jgi:hypothetical protein
MESKEVGKKEELSKKYNLEAMGAYNFENVDFDISFGEVNEKELEQMKKAEQVEL